jgi:hypothetical protein
VDVEDLRRVLGSVFLRDLRTVEPEKKGLLVGDDLRIHEEKGAYVLRFLKGTPESTRAKYRTKLDEGSIPYKVGKDFTT